MTDRDGASRGGTAAAFFDVDGTLADTTIAHYFRYFMLERLSPVRGRIWYAGFLVQCGYYIVLDKIDRGRFNRVFYRNYAGIPADEIKSLAIRCHDAVTTPRLFADAVRCVDDHRSKGDAIVLVTGSLDIIVRPLAEELGASHVVAASLVERNGCFTGELTGPPIGMEEKARRMRELADREGIDLSRSYAYGDSIADLPMLEAVGFPHAVNPDRKLAAVVAARGWPIQNWKNKRRSDEATEPQSGVKVKCAGENTADDSATELSDNQTEQSSNRPMAKSPNPSRRSVDCTDGVSADR